MLTDNEIKLKGIEALIDALGKVSAEKFIALVQNEKFDYTEWQKKLFTGMSLNSLSEEAMEYQQKLKRNGK